MNKILLPLLIAACLLMIPGVAGAADNSLALTITPPLAKINMEPGESLATALKVVNNNSYPVTIYAKAVDFQDKGNGEIQFLNNGNLSPNPENSGVYLSQWITLSQEKVEVEPFHPTLISFSIDVPKDAQPGGHYAAILVGTEPPADSTHGTEIKVSSYLSSLLLVTIAGDIKEKGMITQFVFSPRLYQGGTGNFTVSFKNLGNVDLKPQGDIKIYDMFGKPKADIPVNLTPDFGYVLPKAERTWNNFKWSGDDFVIINRYRAELALSYGNSNTKQTDYQTFFFWGVNLRALAIIGGSLLALFLIIILLMKFYIRQSVKRLERRLKAAGKIKAEKKIIKKSEVEEAPAEKKIIDLRKK
jgi:hypothetical protein